MRKVQSFMSLFISLFTLFASALLPLIGHAQLSNPLSAQVLPGDTIFLPEKFDRESAWSQSVRTAKDFTQVLYQLGLGAAAIKTLRQ